MRRMIFPLGFSCTVIVCSEFELVSAPSCRACVCSTFMGSPLDLCIFSPVLCPWNACCPCGGGFCHSNVGLPFFCFFLAHTPPKLWPLCSSVHLRLLLVLSMCSHSARCPCGVWGVLEPWPGPLSTYFRAIRIWVFWPRLTAQSTQSWTPKHRPVVVAVSVAHSLQLAPPRILPSLTL